MKGSELRRKGLRVWAALLVLLSAGDVALRAAPTKDDKKGNEEEERFRYDAKNRRDPFVPLVINGRLVSLSTQPVGGEEIKPVLYGILWDPDGHSLALLNDEELRVGDWIGAYQVKEIRHDAVVLDGGEGPVVLTIAFDAPSPESAPNATKGR